MAPQAVLGLGLPGRYPRWGYLDRLEVNEHMPRACAATLALFAMTMMVAAVAQHVSPTTHDPLASVRLPSPEEVTILPAPIDRKSVV